MFGLKGIGGGVGLSRLGVDNFPGSWFQLVAHGSSYRRAGSPAPCIFDDDVYFVEVKRVFVVFVSAQVDSPVVSQSLQKQHIVQVVKLPLLLLFQFAARC